MKRRTFLEQIKTKRLDNNKKIIDFLKDKKIKILANGNSHSYGPIGHIFKVGINAIPVNNSTITRLTTSGNNIQYKDFVVLTSDNKEDLINSIKDIESEINILEEQKQLETTKLEYLEDTKLKKFDITKYKKYSLEKILNDDSLSNKKKIEKISLITEME